MSSENCHCGQQRVPARRTLTDGRIVCGMWCLACGSWTNRSRTSFRWDTTFETFTDERQTEIWARRNREREAKHQAQRAEESARWWALYDEYLAGPVWADKRAAVMKRDKHWCQCCLSAPATEVHHLKYPPPEKFGSEPAFDLVSVCRECHDTIHGR